MMTSSGEERKTIRVAVVEDRPEIRDGLAALIDGTAGYRCTARFGSMEQALAGLKTHPPDVVLLDIGLPGMSGIEGIPLLHAIQPGILVIVLTIYEDDQRIFDALCAGACGYLLKKTPPARLLEGVREAIDGGSPMSPTIARRVIEIFKNFTPPPRADHGLTPHELRLLGLIAEGHHYKTAAAALGVSVSTISFHLQQIYTKLHVHSKSEAVAKALRTRLIG